MLFRSLRRCDWQWSGGLASWVAAQPMASGAPPPANHALARTWRAAETRVQALLDQRLPADAIMAASPVGTGEATIAERNLGSSAARAEAEAAGPDATGTGAPDVAALDLTSTGDSSLVSDARSGEAFTVPPSAAVSDCESRHTETRDELTGLGGRRGAEAIAPAPATALDSRRDGIEERLSRAAEDAAAESATALSEPWLARQLARLLPPEIGRAHV